MFRLLGLSISAGTVLLLYLRFADGLGAELRHLASTLDITTFAIAIGLTALNFLSAGLRYRLLLQSLTSSVPSLGHILQLNVWSLLMAHAAPLGGAADVARFAYQRNVLGMSTGLAARSVILDRLLAVFTMAVAGLVLLPLQAALGAPFRLCLIQAVLWLPIALGFPLGALLAGHVAPRMSGRLALLTREVGEMCRVVAAVPRLATQLGIGVLYCVSFGLIPWVLLKSAGVDAEPWLFVAISPALLFAQSFPLSYIGWGVREWAVMLLAGGATAIGEGALVSASVATGLVLFVCSLPGILFWLRVLRK
ncbi:lysylphosphatidylglycerol synthase transmembrane domain-containing protein [Desertibaculum subflavum]|uniref:lysylphosphatidylglycerol synthase transmembrane domain-containing protein n=1 Tax=Desertibaculum subflavum TaxID=2268458 RepID=UPI000E66B5C7